MKKTIATLIDELSVVNIKIYMLIDKIQKNEQTREEAEKLEELNRYRLELREGLNKSKPMKKSLAALIEELTVTNIKIFMLVDKIRGNKHTRNDAKKAQDLNYYRSQLCNSLNRAFKERENIKI